MRSQLPVTWREVTQNSDDWKACVLSNLVVMQLILFSETWSCFWGSWIAPIETRILRQVNGLSRFLNRWDGEKSRHTCTKMIWNMDTVVIMYPGIRITKDKAQNQDQCSLNTLKLLDQINRSKKQDLATFIMTKSLDFTLRNVNKNQFNKGLMT